MSRPIQVLHPAHGDRLCGVVRGGEMERLGFDPEGTWVTGSPLGDAALLWSVTWVRWP
jgi:hypothetical protein